MQINDKILKSDEKAIFKLRELYGQYGYTQYKMRKFEEYDLYAQNKDFLVSDSVITFTDTNGKLLALKPDVTLSIIKDSVDVENFAHKLYYNENVYRISKSTHAYKEITQVGLECIGKIDSYNVAEVVLLAVKSLAAIKENFVLDISQMEILQGVFEDVEVDMDTKKKIIFGLSQKNLHEVKLICSNNNLSSDFCEKLSALIGLYGKMSEVLVKLENLCDNEMMQKGLANLKEICDILVANGYEDKINIDFSLINDMNYYSGIAFKGFVEGISEGVLVGGEYDNLMRKMGKKSGGIGFAVYLDMLERLDVSESEYDVDTLLLYDDNVSVKKINTAIKTFANDNGILVERSIDKNLRYRRLLKVTDKGVEIVENNN